MPMEPAAYVDAVKSESQDLITAVGQGAMDVPVPTCEGWEVRDLALHVGEFCGFWSHVLCEATGRPKTPFPDPPGGDDLAGWLADRCVDLAGELEATPPQVEVWTWFDADHTAGFVRRRTAHEIAIHRFDAQSAHGITMPVPPELAADGIDEILDVLVTARTRTGTGTGSTMVLRSTDLGLDWAVTIEADHIDVHRGTQDDPPVEGSQLIVTGSASDLELTLYHRPTLGTVDVHGDYSVLDSWHHEFTF
jgi:uncharacterized protein (TIGR03083 family)